LRPAAVRLGIRINISKQVMREREIKLRDMVAMAVLGIFVQNGSGVHPAFYPRSQNEWSCTSTPPICLHVVVLN